MIDRAKSTIGNGCITDNTPILIARNFYPKSFIDKIRDEKECSTHLQYQLKAFVLSIWSIAPKFTHREPLQQVSDMRPAVLPNNSVQCAAQTQNQWGPDSILLASPVGNLKGPNLERIWKDVARGEYERRPAWRIWKQSHQRFQIPAPLSLSWLTKGPHL